MRDNLTVKASQLQIDDQKVKYLRGKDIILVKVVWGGHVGGIMTWELESRMRKSYPELFRSGNSLGKKLYKWMRDPEFN